MRIHTALAAFLLPASLLFQVSAAAQSPTHAQLRLLVVDQANVAVPSATVTLFTLDGNPGVTVTADEKGVAVFSDVAVGMAEIVAKRTVYSPYIDKTTLKVGRNAQRVTLPPAEEGADSQSGS